MVERIVRQSAQVNEKLTRDILKKIFGSKQGQRTNMHAFHVLFYAKKKKRGVLQCIVFSCKLPIFCRNQ